MPVNEKKKSYAERLCKCIDTYKQALIVTCDNVGSRQMQQIRIALRGTATVVMGKNTTIKKVIKDYVKRNGGTHAIQALSEHMTGNVGLVFTNADAASVRDAIIANKKPAPARVASFAPVDVFVEPGPTGCDPGQTGWFQALNIPTKINKGQIEMISRVQLLKIGDKVGESQAALLQKLKILPFSYGMKVIKIYENGAIFPEDVLDISAEVVMKKFALGLSTLAAASLGLGYPTKASLVHSINHAFKAILSISLGTDYKVPQVAIFEEALKNPGAFSGGGGGGGGGAAAAPKAAAAKVEEKKEEEEEEDAGGAGGLFGGDDDW